MHRADTGAATYTAQFKAERTGDLFLFVNDAILYWPGPIDAFYRNNKGSAEIKIEPVK
jgi:hypothetical protein